jgi:hypothetical protein
MKRTKHSTTSKEQLEFLEKIKKYPYATGQVCYGAKEAIRFIELYI